MLAFLKAVVVVTKDRFLIKNCYTFYPKPREVEEKKRNCSPKKLNFSTEQTRNL